MISINYSFFSITNGFLRHHSVIRPNFIGIIQYYGYEWPSQRYKFTLFWTADAFYIISRMYSYFSLAFLYIWYVPTLVNNDDSKFSLIYIHIPCNLEKRKTTHITFHWIQPSLNVMYVNVQLDIAGGYSRVSHFRFKYVRLIWTDGFDLLWRWKLV